MAIEDLTRIISERGATRRSLTAVAGPPGSGKSTLAEDLVAALNRNDPGSAELVPMDGYHLDDIVLEARGLRPRKGAPETFDVAGLAIMLERLRRNEDKEIFIPRFDRSIEIARAAAGVVPQTARHLVVEGNYLLLSAQPWAGLASWFDTTIFLDISRDLLRQRLIARWEGFGFGPQEVLAKVDDNDMRNVDFVLANSASAEFVLNDIDQARAPA